MIPVPDDLWKLCLSYLNIYIQQRLSPVVYPTVYHYLEQYNDPTYSKQYVHTIQINKDKMDKDLESKIPYHLFPNLYRVCIFHAYHLDYLPYYLKELKLVGCLSCSIDLRSFQWLESLEISFTQTNSLNLPMSLRSLTMESVMFIQPFSIPIGSLLQLSISQFNQPLPVLPSTLTSLIIDTKRMGDLENLPEGLKQLQCNWLCNTNHDGISTLHNLPTTLTELSCYYTYSLQYIDLSTTKQLIKLVLSGCSIYEINLPSSLLELECTDCPNLVVCKLPDTLTKLSVDRFGVRCIDLGNLPDHLNELDLFWQKELERSLRLPVSLKKLYCTRRIASSIERTEELIIQLYDSDEEEEEEDSCN